MKKLFITSMIGLLPAVIAAQEKQINCDDLSDHIKDRIWGMEHFSDGRFSGVFYYQDIHALKRLAVNIHIKGTGGPTLSSIDCKEAGEENNKNASYKLFDSIAQFKQFHKTLNQCVENSGISCPEALHALNMLQEKMDMYSRCIALFNEGHATRAAAMKKAAEAKAKEEAFDKFINEVNKK